jgi:hypothetical protein
MKPSRARHEINLALEPHAANAIRISGGSPSRRKYQGNARTTQDV